MDAKIVWNSQLSFTGIVRGHETEMDATLASGGLNQGPTPKEILLDAMCACSGIDVIAILGKQKITPLAFEMNAHAEQTKTTPAYFSFIHVEYKFLGELDPKAVINSVHLSMTKYCGVSYMFNKVCPITYDIFLNGEKIHSDQAKFSI
ncbi:MAG: OsmC family protein [Bacteriovorax sp.]